MRQQIFARKCSWAPIKRCNPIATHTRPMHCRAVSLMVSDRNREDKAPRIEKIRIAATFIKVPIPIKFM